VRYLYPCVRKNVPGVPPHTCCDTPIKAGAVPGIGNTSSTLLTRCPLPEGGPQMLELLILVAVVVTLAVLALGGGHSPLTTTLRTRLRLY